MWHDSFMNVTWLTHYIWHGTWLARHTTLTLSFWHLLALSDTYSLFLTLTRSFWRHVTFMSESRHIHEWVMSHWWISHVTIMNEFWMSHGTFMNESCHIYECIMAHFWMSHGTFMNATCHVYAWMRNVTHLANNFDANHIHGWVMAHS